jgi:hypothetical protein
MFKIFNVENLFWNPILLQNHCRIIHLRKSQKIHLRKPRKDPVFIWMFASGKNSISNMNTDTMWLFCNNPFLQSAYLTSHRILQNDKTEYRDTRGHFLSKNQSHLFTIDLPMMCVLTGWQHRLDIVTEIMASKSNISFLRQNKNDENCFFLINPYFFNVLLVI